jgi:high-affinity K+ transport system ATPase subunit B
MWRPSSTTLGIPALFLTLLLPAGVQAQHEHAGHSADSAKTMPAAATLAGQDAFAAMAEVVRILRADPATDWSKVDLEGLRQHLVDMNEVTLKSRVTSSNVPSGARFLVTGEGRTRDAIRRMVSAHAVAVSDEQLLAAVDTIPGGVSLTVTARPGSEGRIAEIRGLGFIGIMVTGNHHQTHHLMVARGMVPEGHSRE